MKIHQPPMTFAMFAAAALGGIPSSGYTRKPGKPRCYWLAQDRERVAAIEKARHERGYYEKVNRETQK